MRYEMDTQYIEKYRSVAYQSGANSAVCPSTGRFYGRWKAGTVEQSGSSPAQKAGGRSRRAAQRCGQASWVQIPLVPVNGRFLRNLPCPADHLFTSHSRFRQSLYAGGFSRCTSSAETPKTLSGNPTTTIAGIEYPDLLWSQLGSRFRAPLNGRFSNGAYLLTEN